MSGDDLHARIARLATIKSPAAGRGITREVHTPAYREALAYVGELMREAGLEVSEDPIGNLFGHWPGSDPEHRRS